MNINKKKCRCCGENNFFKKGFAEIAPFFSIFGLHLIPQNTPIITVFGMCSNCNMLAPWPEYSDESLYDYYSFYLTKEYKNERIKYEQSYASIANLHGCEEEMKLRCKSNEEFLLPFLIKHKKKLNKEKITFLDYGGGEGLITPKINFLITDVFNYSLEKKIKNYNKYDSMQILHVLEHVGNPNKTLETAIELLDNNGLLFIEVPYELNDNDFIAQNTFFHEHINRFNVDSIKKLCESLKLNIIYCKEDFLQQIHIKKSKIIRCVCIK